MKAARLFAVIAGVVGAALMLFSGVLCFASLDAPAKLTQEPKEAIACAEELVNALESGDLTAAAEKMYGQPELGTRDALYGEAAAVWDIFCTGISCRITSECYVSGSHLAMDAEVTVPDITSITDTLQEHARTLMKERIASATEMAQLYDAENNFRMDLIEDVMAQAVEQAFRETPEMLTTEVTLELLPENGTWYVLPDAALLKALSGGLA